MSGDRVRITGVIGMPPPARGGVGGSAATPRPRVRRTDNRLMGAVNGTGGGITGEIVVACGTLCAVLVGTAGEGGAAGARTGVCGRGTVVA